MTEVLQQEEPKQNDDIPLSVDTDNQQILLNGSSSKRRSTSVESVDPDAQEMLISSLRTQIQDLFAQVNLLNSKLVKSYDRISDLEDDLHVASANLRSSSSKISQLELERTQHLSALNTGLLVEKSHVTTELNRLMEKATEEAAQRGQAESARIAIEKELDDLSASLFDQANTMVAEARFGKHLSERKVEDAERALKTAEEAVQLMQVQMQFMQAEKEETEKRSREMEMVVSKGERVERRRNDDISISLRLLNSHGPYQDYLAFISHLRVLHLTSPSPPTMTMLLPLPFLARLLNEDSEPTVRLDLAPSLNWLSRRSVLAAIHSGQLTIEPISAASLFAESMSYTSSTTVAGVHSSNDNISCALCSAPIFPVTESSHPNGPNRPPTITSNTSPPSWSGSFFKRTASMGYIINSRPPSPSHSTSLSSIDSTFQIYIFKLASLPTSTMSSLPISSLSKSSSQSTSSSIPLQSTLIHNGLPTSSPSNQSVTIYPLCRTGWCLSRLRATCTLWAFVRTGIVDKVWEEAITLPTPPPVQIPTNTEKPPLPPRKRGLWGIASAIGERAASWSEGDKDKTKKPPLPNPREQTTSLVKPPDSIPSSSSTVPPSLRNSQEQRELPVIPPDSTAVPSSSNTVSPPLLNPQEQREPPVISPDSTAVPSSSNTTPPPLPKPQKPGESPVIPPDSTAVPSSSTTVPPPLPNPQEQRESPLVPSDSTAAPSSTTVPSSATTSSTTTVPSSSVPNSRPSTPSVVPSRTASPAAIGSVGAPPPLPRRAATRGVRSTATADAAAAASVSRSGTPVNGLESTAIKATTPETEEMDKDKGKLATAATAASVSRSGTPVNGLESAAIKAETLETEEMDKDKGRYAAAAAASVSRAGTPMNGLESAAIKAETLETEEMDKDKGRYAAASVSRSVTPANGLKSAAIMAQTIETEETDKDNGQYVGNGSWEEKTWKELVRLREDMFWARLGGFRG